MKLDASETVAPDGSVTTGSPRESSLLFNPEPITIEHRVGG